METGIQKSTGLSWSTGLLDVPDSFMATMDKSGVFGAYAKMDKSGVFGAYSKDFEQAGRDAMAAVGDMTGAGYGEENGDQLFDSRGAPKLAPPGELSMRDPMPVPVPIEVRMARADSNRMRASETMVNDRANESYNDMKLHVDKYMDAQRQSIAEFRKKVAEFAEKAKSWFSRLFKFVSKYLGPVAPWIGFAAALTLTIATGGATFALLGLAALSLVGSVLSQCGVDVAGAVSKAVTKGLCAIGVPKEKAQGIADIVSAVPTLLLLDPTSIGKLFRGVAELAGADKSTVQKWESIGNIVGAVLVLVASAALTFGTGLGPVLASATTKITTAVASTTAKLAKAVTSAAPQLISTMASHLSEIAYAARMVQAGTNGLSAVTGIGSGASNIMLAGAQSNVDNAEAERNLIQQLASSVREDMAMFQETMRRALEKVAENCKASAQMIDDYSRFTLEKASIQSAPLTA